MSGGAGGEVWARALSELGWSGRDAVNLAETMADRHAGLDRPALVWEGRDGRVRSFGFRDLSEAAARHANLLRDLGIGPGDAVASVMPRVPEALVAMLGAFRLGAVHLPIFSGFAPEAVAQRVARTGAKVVVTHAETRARVPPSRRNGAAGARVLTVGGPGEPGDIPYEEAVAAQRADGPAGPRRRNDPAVLLFTSGSTGAPKAVAVATNFPAAIWPALRLGADLRPEGDRLWPTGDPGWGYGLVCYGVGLALGATCLMWEATPEPAAALDFLVRYRVTNLATVPTLLRGVMALGEGEVARPGFAPRSVAACGEPLNAAVIEFFRRAWGVTPLDQFGSSEHGLPIGNRYAERDRVRPGSMGRPLPGHRIAVVDEAGQPVERGVVGLIASLPPPDATYALGYLDSPEANRNLRRGEGWIVTGDLGREDTEGYLWFEGRADDVIKSAGYRIGPFEVESALLAHPAVAEAAVVGRPDAARGQVVKAFVVLRPGHAPRPGLEAELAATVRERLGAHAYPREVEFVRELPKTNSGKIQRFLLREREAAVAAQQREATAP